MHRSALAALVAGSIGLGATVAPAATLVENFHYGDTSRNLNGLGAATDGWAGAWFGDNATDYFANRNLAYSGTGYSNADNGPGAIGYGGGDAGNITTRVVPTALTGTVWVSALVEISSNSGDALLWMRNDPHGANANMIGLRGSINGTDNAPVAYLRYGSATNSQSVQTFALDTTHLLLAKIDVDYFGALDRIQFWVNPDLSGGEAGLGAPLLSGEGSDVMANVAGPRVSFQAAGSTMDAIRISNDADGFLKVTAVPEPASLAVLGLAAGALLGRRRR